MKIMASVVLGGAFVIFLFAITFGVYAFLSFGASKRWKVNILFIAYMIIMSVIVSIVYGVIE